MFEIVFEFCAMVFVIVTVSAWCIILPMSIKIWIDAALIHIPIPVYDWPYPLNLGYFECKV